MADYCKQQIPLRMNRPAAVKALNDRILAGERRGYSEFEITVTDTQTYSNVCAPIAGILEYYKANKAFDFRIIYDVPNGYIEHTCFESPLNVFDEQAKISLLYPFDKVWRITSSDDINLLVNAYILAVRQADVVKPGVISSLEWCLNETMDNVLQHSGIEAGYVMAQLHKTTQQFSVCIFDTGVGIYNSLKHSKHNPSSRIDAITLALQEKITRDESIGQGNGLWGLSQLIADAQGSLTISSAGAVYKNASGSVQTVASGSFNLGKDTGTTCVDFQLNYSHEINIAHALNGYEPVDLWLEELEIVDGTVCILVAEHSNGTGTRKSAEKLRTLVLNIVIADRKKVILDFSGINVISSSFADELIGKIICEYGFVFFVTHFEITNLSRMNTLLVNRSVQQRMAQMYYDDSIESSFTEF